MKPEAITPAVEYMLSENGPTKTIMGAGADRRGRFLLGIGGCSGRHGSRGRSLVRERGRRGQQRERQAGERKRGRQRPAEMASHEIPLDESYGLGPYIRGSGLLG
jgi:hypothetical protein